jgi:hypothetical protein
MKVVQPKEYDSWNDTVFPFEDNNPRNIPFSEIVNGIIWDWGNLHSILQTIHGAHGCSFENSADSLDLKSMNSYSHILTNPEKHGRTWDLHECNWAVPCSTWMRWKPKDPLTEEDGRHWEAMGLRCVGKMVGKLGATPANRASEKWNHVVNTLSGYTSVEFAAFVITIGGRTGLQTSHCAFTSEYSVSLCAWQGWHAG